MSEQPIVVVRGEASREVPPELAVFSVTASARERDRDTALARLTARAAEVRTVLDEFDAAIERRETSGIRVQPDFKRRGEKVVAYQGSVGTTVTVTDFAQLGDLLLRLAGLDGVAISGPWWRLRPGSRADAEVRRDAIAEALSRAREYADAVGARVDRLIEISDEGVSGAAPMMRAAMAYGAADELSLDVDPAAQTVSASVVVRVSITDPVLPE